MIIDKKLRSPEVLQIKISYTSEKPEHKILEKWGWCRLGDIVRCLNNQNLGLEFTPQIVMTNFAALNGHEKDGSPVVTYITHSDCALVGPDYQINQLFKNLSFGDGLIYMVPAGWARKILSLKAKHNTKSAVDGSLLYPVHTRLSRVAEDKLVLFAQSARGITWELPLGLSPDRWKIFSQNEDEW